METMTEEQAIQLANDFVKSQSPSPEYTLKYASISKVEGKYQIRYDKVFKEPTKENPPYRLVVVEPAGSIYWGMQ
jgi:hypothetical protein